MTRKLRSLFITVSAILVPLSIATSSPLPEEWKNIQRLEVNNTGLLKFGLPPATLDAARPNLADLRIFDPDGNEVPYAIEKREMQQHNIAAAKAFHVFMEPQSTSVLVEPGLKQQIDAIEFQTSSTKFIKSVQLEGSEDSIRWKVLSKGQPISRQPDGTSQLQISIPHGIWRFLRATIDDSRSEPIAISGIYVHMVPEKIPEEDIVPKLLERSENSGQTRILLDLGAANLTLAAIEIETPELIFRRRVTAAVQEISEKEIQERTVATGIIERLSTQELTPAHFPLTMDLMIRSRKLLMLIDNGESPPLAISAIKVRRRPVYVVFVTTKIGTYSILTGNSNYEAPKYDLSSISSNLSGVLLIDPEISVLSRNPAYRKAEALPEITHLSTSLDISDWKYRKKVNTETNGVQELEMDLQVLSHAQHSLQDLRLMHKGKQIPYVFERTSTLMSIDAQGSEEKDPDKPRVTLWKLKLPYRSLPVMSLQCKTQTSIFKRSVLVYEMVPDDRGNEVQRSLGQTGWIRTPGEKRTTLAVPMEPPLTDLVLLEIHNGDNPPISVGNFRFMYKSTKLLFKMVSGLEPFLYYGNSASASPEYDIRLVAP